MTRNHITIIWLPFLYLIYWFLFSLPLIFTLQAASISHFLTATMKFSCFSSDEIHLLCFQSLTLVLSFSVIHMSVNIKNNIEKDTTLLLFFLSKNLGGHAISLQTEPWVAFGLPYCWLSYFTLVCLWCGQKGRGSVTWLPKFLRWVDYHIFFPWCFAAHASRMWELHYKMLHDLHLHWISSAAGPVHYQ